MANAAPIKTGGGQYTLETRLFTIPNDLELYFPYQTHQDTKYFHIKGLKLGSTGNSGTFDVRWYGEQLRPHLRFSSDDFKPGDTVRISYMRSLMNASTVTALTSSKTASGSLYAHWPVYSSGTDVNQSAIKGYLHLTIPRVRVTALPGFDSSYKSAATNSVTFSAVDPKEANERMYQLTYEPLDPLGNIVVAQMQGAEAPLEKAAPGQEMTAPGGETVPNLETLEENDG